MSNDFFPLVSIIIPVFNGADFMREAIDSALDQTYKNIEIIVINDGSNDDGETERIALSYGDRIRYFWKENGGVSSALNLGISKMKGEYFSWLSHDDKYAQKKIESQIASIGQCSEKNVVSLCGVRYINAKSEFISDVKKIHFKPHVLINATDVLIEMFRHGCFCGCALLIPKKIFDIVGTFHEGLRFSQDYLKWIQIFLGGYSLIYNDDPYVYSRIHNKQLTQRGQQLFHTDSDVMCDIVLEGIADKSTLQNNILYAYALNNAKYGNNIPTKKCIEKAKEKNLLNAYQATNIKLMCLYGKMRPNIRKIYYKLMRKI